MRSAGSGALRWPTAWPAHWLEVPAARLFRDRREPADSSLVQLTPSQTYGVLPQAEYMTRTGNRVVLALAEGASMKTVYPNDFVIHLRSFQGGIEWSGVAGRVSAAYTVLAPKPELHPGFFRWVLKSAAYVQLLRLTTNQLRDGQSIKFGDFKKVPLPVPPLEEQRAIADYLDRETARIDHLIAKQERLIELLRERRFAAVDSAVACPVGAAFRLGHLFRPVRVNADRPEEILSVYREYGVIRKDSRDDNSNQTPEDVSRYLVVHPGDLVINRMKAWQGSLGISSLRGVVSPDYEVLRPAQGALVSPYLHALLRSPAVIAQYGRLSTGIRPSQWRLYWSSAKSIEVTLPTPEQQMLAADRLRTDLAKIDALIAKAQQFIKLSKERRAALITAAVTGQIDVREMAA